MIRTRLAADRGHADLGWLKTSYTFSFNTYHDPAHMGFRVLRVINEDVVLPGQGFGVHGHRDMEIITYVMQGELEHRDSLGNGGIVRAGELQRMTAGTGIRHSEFNPSPSEPLHLYQIWIVTRSPRACTQLRAEGDRTGRWGLLAAIDCLARRPGWLAHDPSGCEGPAWNARARAISSLFARARAARMDPGCAWFGPDGRPGAENQRRRRSQRRALVAARGR